MPETVGFFIVLSKPGNSLKTRKITKSATFYAIERKNAYESDTSDCTETRLGNDGAKTDPLGKKISGVWSDW